MRLTLAYKIQAINIYKALHDEKSISGHELSSLEINHTYIIVNRWLMNNAFWVIDIV